MAAGDASAPAPAVRADDPVKVDVFVLGDSISMQYGPALEERLEQRGFTMLRKGAAAIDDRPHIAAEIAGLHPPGTPPENGGDSAAAARYLRLLASPPAVACRVLVMNAGLHDIRVPPADASKDPAARSRRVPPEAYAANVAAMLATARALADAVLWVDTTPVVDEAHNDRPDGGPGFCRFDLDRQEYARLAAGACAEASVVRLDLAAITVAEACGAACAGGAGPPVGPLSEAERAACARRLVDHVHWDDAMRRIHGTAVAEAAISLLHA